jgi:hypothetical protein
MPGLTFGFWRRNRRESAAPKALARKDDAPQVDFDRILAGIGAAPQLEMIEWRGDGMQEPATPIAQAAMDFVEESFDAS